MNPQPLSRSDTQHIQAQGLCNVLQNPHASGMHQCFDLARDFNLGLACASAEPATAFAALLARGLRNVLEALLATSGEVCLIFLFTTIITPSHQQPSSSLTYLSQ
ncbi:hypothetical protein THER5_1975 [Bifidobacterium thermacidophilum subsp. thermacidophilum]|uniref:Uncharacterized protein n=1 Tax=Bifidobacterium thermacidophilum subsp. thermacidophilum TaxID=79262 RepID=A0A087E433_9BIFI|nr:hypothetical protein THER5_1975 [Bifidobacterium thermacidophilum subsp. thermacidophilum]